MEKLQWPVCEACQGYGTMLLNSITHQRSTEPCPTCGGGGRVAPAEPAPVEPVDPPLPEAP